MNVFYAIQLGVLECVVYSLLNVLNTQDKFGFPS